MISPALRAARALTCALVTLLGFPCEPAAADVASSSSSSSSSSSFSSPIPPSAPIPAPPVAIATAPTGTCYDIGGGRSACFDRPRVHDFLLEAPGNLGRWLRDSARPENLPWVATVALSTAILVKYDQDLVDNTRKGARNLGVSAKGKQRDIIPGIPVQYPTDVGSAIYYFGDGMVPAVALTGILGYGLLASDDRALRTASHLGAGLLATGVTTQTIKRLTGRQTPNRATAPGGKWQWFPGPREYQKNVPNFDAYPSGHVATLMLTMTVLHADYPEAWWILPVGWTLMVPLWFQMMNNGVHWASDYPLAIAIGYGLGKQAVRSGRRVVSDATASAGGPAPAEYSVVPFPAPGGGGLALVGTF